MNLILKKKLQWSSITSLLEKITSTKGFLETCDLSNKYTFDLMLLNLDFLQKELLLAGDKVLEPEEQLKSALSMEDFQK